MSQEQPPIRSRRELRKARDAQQPSVSTGTEQLSPATKRPGPGASGATSQAPEQTHTQRSSQIRARDRAALRTIKELEEKEGQLAGGGAPTRRQLRLQQLKEQALTAATPIVAPAAPPVNEAGNRPGKEKSPAGQEPKGAQAPAAASRTSTLPEGMTVEQALAARSLIAEQAKNQIAKMQHIASLDPEAVDPEILAEQIALAERAAVLNRRAMAKQKLAEQTGVPVAGQEPLPGHEPVPAPEPAPGKHPPAGKSSVPRRPAPGRQKSSQQEPKARASADQRAAPSTASNLAMVTPLEFVQVPGVDRPVMKPPATSHVPVTTRPGTKIPPAAGTKKRRPAGGPRPAEPDGGTGRSQVIARAEAAARAAARPKPVLPPAAVASSNAEDAFEGLPRIPARSAHGLDPLDAATAGLARANRNRILQFCVLAFGILALISGIVLIFSGMSH
ncbi:hypothetical protein [Arthrobacter sp. W4I7]|uniref:hypothetical protein n=1 Tax=Arthrobacter sp. W4I7 TaxID=3042296 RepID=UPI0027804CA0|nr:hypothetical protein [Arthrobacter sp. W4I7]MDQ0690665.1 hypothetical protein [Arthrobacter sp. W4I7]